MRKTAIATSIIIGTLGAFSVSAMAACPPGTRSEGGTGGKGGEEICFGTPTAEQKTVKPRAKKVRRARAAQQRKRPVTSVQRMNNSSKCKWSAWACGE